MYFLFNSALHFPSSFWYGGHRDSFTHIFWVLSLFLLPSSKFHNFSLLSEYLAHLAGSLVLLSQLFCFSVGGSRESFTCWLRCRLFEIHQQHGSWVGLPGALLEDQQAPHILSCVLLLVRESFFYFRNLLSVMKLGLKLIELVLLQLFCSSVIFFRLSTFSLLCSTSFNKFVLVPL